MAEDSFAGALRFGASTSAQVPVARARGYEASTGLVPQVAIRARLNAIVLDLILLGFLTRGLAGAIGHSVDAGTAFLLFWGLEFAYFFTLEAVRGQTLGKRLFHVRVVTLEGARPSIKQLAVRNILRIFDALPLFYASGLLSVMRTGRDRRQRIGDVAAGTTVVLDIGGRQLPTPRWLLPVATAFSTLISLAVVIPLLK